jgi:hypothetical protein
MPKLLRKKPWYRIVPTRIHLPIKLSASPIRQEGEAAVWSFQQHARRRREWRERPHPIPCGRFSLLERYEPRTEGQATPKIASGSPRLTNPTYASKIESRTCHPVLLVE